MNGSNNGNGNLEPGGHVKVLSSRVRRSSKIETIGSHQGTPTGKMTLEKIQST
jgi:hypothetical protein